MEVHNIQPPGPSYQNGGFNVALYNQRVNWLYWVAALSGLNTIFALLGVKFGFSVSLGVGSLIIALTKGAGGLAFFAAAVNLAMAVGIGVLGYFAIKRLSMLALCLGLAVMCLDTLLLIGLAIATRGSLIITVLIHLWTCAALGLAAKQLMDRNR